MAHGPALSVAAAPERRARAGGPCPPRGGPTPPPAHARRGRRGGGGGGGGVGRDRHPGTGHRRGPDDGRRAAVPPERPQPGAGRRPARSTTSSRTGRYLPFHEADLPVQTVVRDDGSQVSPHDPLLPAAPRRPDGARRVGGGQGDAGRARRGAGRAPGVDGAPPLRRPARNRGADGPGLRRGRTAVGLRHPGVPRAARGAGGHGGDRRADRAPATRSSSSAFGRRGRRTAVAGVKYVPVAAALVVVARGGPGRRAAAPERGLCSPAGWRVMAGVYLAAHRVIYGGWTVYAAGDHFTGGERR